MAGEINAGLLSQGITPQSFEGLGPGLLAGVELNNQFQQANRQRLDSALLAAQLPYAGPLAESALAARRAQVQAAQAKLPYVGPLAEAELAASRAQVQTAQAQLPYIGPLARAQIGLAGAQIQRARLEDQEKKLSMVNQLAGAVMQQPTQEGLTAALHLAAMSGMDISKFPKNIGAAMPMIKQAYIQSGQALANLTAQRQWDQTQGQLEIYRAGKNIEARNAGMAAPFPTVPGAQTEIGPAPLGQVERLPGDDQKTYEDRVRAQNKSWQDTKNTLTAAAQQYADTEGTLNTLQKLNDMRGLASNTLGVLPITSKPYTKMSTNSQQIEKLSANLQQQLLATLGAHGITRVDIPIVQGIKDAMPSADKSKVTNQHIIDRLLAVNQLTNQIYPQIVQQLDLAGVRDPLVAAKVFQTVAKDTGVYDPKTGETHRERLADWQPIASNMLQVLQLEKANPEFAAVKRAKPELTNAQLLHLWQQYQASRNQNETH